MLVANAGVDWRQSKKCAQQGESAPRWLTLIARGCHWLVGFQRQAHWSKLLLIDLKPVLVFTGYHGYKTVYLFLRVWGLFILNLLIRFTKNYREIILLTPNKWYLSLLLVAVPGHYFQRKWNRPGLLAVHRTTLLALLLPVISGWLQTDNNVFLLFTMVWGTTDDKMGSLRFLDWSCCFPLSKENFFN